MKQAINVPILELTKVQKLDKQNRITCWEYWDERDMYALPSVEQSRAMLRAHGLGPDLIELQ